MDFPCSYGEADLDAQRHPQRHPRRHREVRGLLHVEPRGRLHQRPRAVRGAHLQQRRVHPRQPGEFGRAGQQQRHQRLHQPVHRATPSSTSTARSTATRSRSPAPRSTCPTPTATSGTGPCRGTSGCRCRRCRRRRRPSGIPSTAPVTPTDAPQRPATGDSAATCAQSRNLASIPGGLDRSYVRLKRDPLAPLT